MADDITLKRLPDSTYGAIKVNTLGETFIWKALLGGDHNGWNELIACRLSGLLRLPHVPNTLVFQADGLGGTATQFIPAACSANELQLDPERRKQARAFLTGDEFTRQAALMFVYDTILGNQDRHAGNWLVDLKQKKLWWIDHGSVRWVSTERSQFEALKKLGYTLKGLGVSEKAISRVLEDLQARLGHLPADLIRAWQEVSDQDWQSLFEGCPEKIGYALRDEICARSWERFQMVVENGGIQVSDETIRQVDRKVLKWRVRET